MAIIALPFTTRFAKTIQWTLDRPAQVNRSAWTARRQVIASPWHGIWRAKVELVPVIGEANMLAWRSFLAQLKGQLNTFRLPMTEGGQSTAATGIVSSTSGTYPATAGATQMLFDSPDHAGAGLTAGMFITVNDQPLLLVATPTLDVASGARLATFEPPLRAAVAGSTAIEGRAPTCLVALADSSISWSVEPGKIYGIGTLQVEEAF